MPYGTAPEIKSIPIETKRPNIGIMKVAHRGASKFAPENTLPALEKAINLGFEYIELDVRETKDGNAVLMHDKTIDRTTNRSGQLSDFSLKELKELDAGTRVPTLEEALQLIKGRACIFWDTKGYPNGAKVAIELFKKYDFDRDCLLISFGALGSRDNPTFPKKIAERMVTSTTCRKYYSPERPARNIGNIPFHPGNKCYETTFDHRIGRFRTFARPVSF
jgi:hypothetical protein